MPRVSVIMSVYKEKIEWLRESIESILNQTFKDFEFIIICDNPTYKEGLECLEQYQKTDSRIKLLINEHNIGLTKSLNKGINEAIGEFIVRMDADDVSHPKRIEEQVIFMGRNPDIKASGTGAYIWDGGNKKRAHRRVDYQVLRSMIIFDSPIYHPSAIFYKSINGTTTLYDESFKYSQDYALWISLLKKYQLSNIDKPLIMYRISSEQISSAKHNEQQTYAIQNLKSALALLGIEMSDSDFNILLSLTRTPELVFDLKEIEAFILRFADCIVRRNDLSYREMISYVSLAYINRVTKEKRILPSIYSYIKLCKNVKHFSFYNFFSLISKYI